MKVWSIYLKPEAYEKDERNIQEKYPLYGTTNDKKLLKKFKNQRDMDKFMIIPKNMSSDEYEIYANRHRGTVLKEEEIQYFTHKYYPDNERKIIKLVITQTEVDMVANPEEVIGFMNEIWWVGNVLLPPAMFTEEIQKLLSLFDYSQMYSIYVFNTAYDYDDYGEMFDFDWNYDELSLLLDISSDTFNVDV